MVSVIIVSYNTREITLDCLEHLYRSTFTDFEVIVIDNDSHDGSVAAIKKHYPKIKIIANKTNSGFGAANNQGMAEAKGEYFLLLNSDCFVQPETLDTLTKAMAVLPNIDVAGIKLLNTDGTLQQTMGFFPSLTRIISLMSFIDNLPIVRRFARSIHLRDPHWYKQMREIDWVIGAFVLLKRRVFEVTHGFDEKYFMYGEEVEWMYRMKKAGFRVAFFPQATATHLGGASSPDKAPAIVGEIKGWKYWFYKYAPSWQRAMLPVVVTAGCLLRIALKPNQAKFYRQALREIW